MTHLKICGFQDADSALVAAEAGADSIGVVFIPSARRHVTVEQAEALLGDFRSRLAGRRSPEIVGLFGDQPVDEVNAVVQRLGLDAVQLCGSEGMGYCKQIAVPIYKVIGVDTTVPISTILPMVMILIQRHSLAGHRLVLDAKMPGEYGGTGSQFDWQIAADIAESYQFSLGGGLTPENVGDAIKRVKPAGVDTSSGVETDGVKDAARIRAFVSEARAADASLAKRGLGRFFGRRSA